MSITGQSKSTPSAVRTEYSRQWDVWDMRSVDGTQRLIKAYPSYPGSTRYRSEYQRLVGQVIALNAAEAEALALSGKTVAE